MKPPTTTITGWIFDAYPEPDGMRVWLIAPSGDHVHFLDPWRPLFYVGDGRRPLAESASFLEKSGVEMDLRRVGREELFSGRTLPVLEVRVPPPRHGPLVQSLKAYGFILYNADVHPVQAWHYERGHFPLARGEFSVAGGRLIDWRLLDDPWALDYELPPLRAVHMALTGSEIAGRTDPNQAARGSLSLRYENKEYELEGPPEDQLESLARRLNEWDPDVITSDWGDSHILPRLALWAQRFKRPLPFSRDSSRGTGGRAARSFFTYGRTVYQNASRTLFGRWHLDLKNSFYFRECGMDGLFEVARVAKIPVQRAARTTIGTALTSMQMDRAWKRGVLVPMDKQQTEDFRPADGLLAADKGGLVYEPEIGWYENVAEYDFVSMYPTVMMKKNISPETVNCPCCPENKVPEIGHHLCTRRRGLIPEVLAPILEKRAIYKRLAKTDHPNKKIYKARSDVFKWVQVCVFGYLGFKNARFGKIEAHECVNAWGREILLKAKESVESRGYHVIHALVDSLWIQGRPGMDYEAVRQVIEREAGCPVGLEGIYKWIRFCPSKVDPLSGIPNRYFGAFTTGETKVRGLALRRHDTPRLIKDMQNQLLSRLARADTWAQIRAAGPELEEIIAEFRARLKEGRVTAQDLAILFHLSKKPEEYVHDTLSTIAAKKMAAAGIELHPGEALQYVIASAKDKVKDWRAMPLPLLDGPLEYDQERYLELLENSIEEILIGGPGAASCKEKSQ